MYSLLRNLFFLLPAETAHHLTLNSLNIANQFGFLRDIKLSATPIDVMGIAFPNRIGLAAGLDRNGQYTDALAKFGFGFIEIGTITPSPQSGNPKPRLFRLVKEEALINRMGFANLGLQQTLTHLQHLKYRGILGINIGKDVQTPITAAIKDYVFCFQSLWPYAHYITLNISSPNSQGLRELQHKTYLTDLLHALKIEQHAVHLKSNKYVPLVVKLAPDLTDVEVNEIADILLQEQIDGVIATNTTIQRPGINHNYAHEKGGLSGRPLHALSLNLIKLLYARLGERIPIIACGGTMDELSAREKINAGAKLLQIYTGFIYHGPGLVRRLVNAAA